MATVRRLLLKRANSLAAASSSRTLSASPHLLQPRFYHGVASQKQVVNSFEGPFPGSTPKPTWLPHICGLAASAFLGGFVLDRAYADDGEVAAVSPLPSELPASHENLEEIARKERSRLQDLLKSKGMQYGSYPKFTVAVKGQKIAIKFQVPPTCEIPRLIANLASKLNDGSHVEIQSWDSTVAWQLALKPPRGKKEAGINGTPAGETNSNEGDLCVLIFRSLISPDRPEIEFLKRGSLSPAELDALVTALQIAGEKPGQQGNRSSSGAPAANKSISNLEGMGVRVFGLDEQQRVGSSGNEISWDTIAGYDHQKREIEDTVLLALRSPEVYDDIARGTRRKFESNRPRAVLFEGPPGTGKTSCARVIATQAGVPLLYVPLEVVLSKYYGESERLLGKVFTLANELPEGAIIFLDEVDSFAVARDSEIHEATRRILSVLLRQIDGFEQDKRVVVIAATNRKQDLDPALISRFDSIITFGLPDQQNRQKIAAQYAKHLSETELAEFAVVTEGLSGRDIRDVCQQAERRWASKLIRAQAKDLNLPPLEEYIESAIDRKKSLLEIEEQRSQSPGIRPDKRPLDLS